MSCMFGEIVFPSSRAFWDDDDFDSIDAAAEESAKEFNIEWTDSAPASIDKLIVIESELLIDFANSCLVKDSKKVCTIKNSKTKKEPSTIYKVKDCTYICVVGAEVDLPQSAQFLEKVQEILKLSKQIMVVTCDHVSHFKGDKPDSPSFLRSLSTKNSKKVITNKIPTLSQPNIVSGVSSGVIATAEVMDIPAIIMQQNNVSDVPETSPVEAVTMSKNLNTKSSGRGVKQRRTDNFRRKVGAKQLQEKRKEVIKRLGMSDNSCAELEKSLAGLHVTSVQTTAIPVAVATRGVGFAAVAEYSRMCTTCNFASINEICTIHQYYRVELYLAYYKLYLARYEQIEMPSVNVVAPFTLNEEVRQMLSSIRQVPISTYNIISSIGKIEGSCVWHSVPLQDAPKTGEQMALYLYPSNIRECVTHLADVNFDVNVRNQFHALNPLPGANWAVAEGHWFLQNPDQIWPADYGAEELQGDVHAYCNLLNRVSGRLPQSFIISFTWSGQASKSGLACMDPVPTSLEATFVNEPSPVAGRHTRRRDARGRPADQVAPSEDVPRYANDIMRGCASVVQTWSPEGDITAMELTVGVASFVGEQSGMPTRLQILARRTAHLSPGIVLYRLINAPNSRMA